MAKTRRLSLRRRRPRPSRHSAPLAPAAPPSAKASHWGAPIRGAAPVLATARFAPYPYRLTRKG